MSFIRVLSDNAVMDGPHDILPYAWRHAHFLMLATRCRERAERTPNKDLANSHLMLASGYEALAATFARLSRFMETPHSTG